MIGLFTSSAEKRDRAALAWVQEVHSDSLTEDRLEVYIAWMVADERNAQAFRAMDAAWIAAGDSQDALRAQLGPEAREQTNTSALAVRILGSLRPGLTPQFAGVVAAVCLVAVVALQDPQIELQPQQYATVIGERLDVSLDDGTIVTLNTGSKLTVAFEDDKRVVTLDSGGALFDVASDATRPFVVEMEGGAVEVLGTVFDVLRNPDGFSVTVLEGRVSVSADGEDPDLKAVVLSPDQRAEVNTRMASLTSFSIDAEIATAWRQGQLIYRDADVTAVMADLNRYSTISLSVADQGIDGMRFTGVLTIDAPDIMMERLAGLLKMETIQTEDGGLRLQSID